MILLTLSACASSSKTSPVDFSIPQIPADIQVCFDRQYKPPPGKSYTKKQVIEIITALKRQDIVKTSCGKRLIAWIDAQRGN